MWVLAKLFWKLSCVVSLGKEVDLPNQLYTITSNKPTFRSLFLLLTLFTCLHVQATLFTWPIVLKISPTYKILTNPLYFDKILTCFDLSKKIDLVVIHLRLHRCMASHSPRQVAHHHSADEYLTIKRK